MNATQLAITVFAVLVLSGAAVAVFVLGDSDKAPSAALVVTTTSVPVSPEPAPTIAATATATPPEAAAPLPDRKSCDEIRGTPYRSDSERDFFQETCVTQPPSLTLPDTTATSPQNCETSIEIATSRSDKTYDVTGTTLDEIANSLEASAPQAEGGPAFGLTEYSYGLSGSFCVAGNNSCSLGDVTISANVIVTLPNLTTLEQLTSNLAQIWSDYAEKVAVHEGRHVRILEDGLAEIRRQLLLIGEEPNCDALDHEIDKVWTFGGGQMEQRQRAFHAADAAGSGGLVVQ